MFFKYYDENGYVVGTSCGQLTENVKETSFTDFYQVNLAINSLSESKNIQNGYECHVKEQDNNDYIGYLYDYKKIPESALSDDELKEVLIDEIKNSIVISERPTAKEGYNLKPVVVGNNITWVFEEIKEESENDGTYLKPITYSEGMSIEEGKWYTDGENIWEALKSGTPANFDDKEYFDIIG